jgi:hypothetical protein
MMTIFFIKYLTGYALARKLVIAFQPWFIASVSLSLGLLSGTFLARAGAAWFLARRRALLTMASPGKSSKRTPDGVA